MDEFFEHLKQRKLVQWALAYIAAAFALIQVLDIVGQQFAWPDAARRGITVALGVGFFVTAVLAWYHGERGAQRITGTELLILALLLTIGGALLWRLAPASATSPPATGEAALLPATASVIPHKSIAVLPFTDLSPGHDQEYFSDGMAEEILNALAKVKDLKVAGRTSSFFFKGKNEDLRNVGKALAVANVLEGSVRKQGDKVRITAQLIQAEDGYHLWSESYDGDLSDVFALQERIGRAITEKLEVTLGDSQQRLVPVATTNPEAYALYLQASGIFNRREGPRFHDAIAQLEQALKLDPNFARAHSRLAALMSVAPIYTKVDAALALKSVEEHAHRASELDPTLAEPYAALGTAFSYHRRYLEARDAVERAIALDASDTTAVLWYALELVTNGYVKQGYVELDRLLIIDPMMPNALLWRGMGYAYDGDMVKAEQLLQRASDAKLAFAGLGLSFVTQHRGKQADAIAQLSTAFKALDPSLPDGAADVLAVGVLGDAPSHATAFDWVDKYIAGKPQTVSGIVAYALIRMGAPARALAITKDHTTTNDPGLLSIIWSSYGREARTRPEFPEYVRTLGLTAVWERYGPPDFCQKSPSGDYTCE